MSDARRTLSFTSEDEAIADVQALRRGYVQAGRWSLPQMCAHLDKAVRSRMQPGPFPPNTPEQDARRATADRVLATGRLPDGIIAPDTLVPRQDVDDDAIDAFIATLREFKSFQGPIAPHRLFGHLPDADARRLNLIHCAHHLSYLTRRVASGQLPVASGE